MGNGIVLCDTRDDVSLPMLSDVITFCPGGQSDDSFLQEQGWD
jgi:hypothetical protein